MTQNAANDGHGPAEETARTETPAENQAPENELERVTGERDDFRDKLLRTLADMENLRRRTEREIADAKAYAVTSFARDMLGVADNLRRALEALPAGSEDAQGGALKTLTDGVELTERDLLKTLERHGVRKIEPLGEKFDPNLHQAMFEAPHPQTPKGMVSQVVQSGFKIGERVLRPALVGVSAGQPKPVDGAAAAGEGKTDGA